MASGGLVAAVQQVHEQNKSLLNDLASGGSDNGEPHTSESSNTRTSNATNDTSPVAPCDRSRRPTR
jgi:hypothetical protein